jgi:hypothetical protein
VRRLLEDDGTAVVDQDAVFEVPADGAGQDRSLHLAARADCVTSTARRWETLLVGAGDEESEVIAHGLLGL